jgi:protein-S-isoprenylcysteine O-methyltransferase Ste14
MKLKLDVANYFLLIILVNLLLHYSIPLKQIVNFPFKWIGLFLFILGWIPNIWMGIYFRKIKSPIPSRQIPKKLITSGLFKISRNPIYLGMVITLFGEAIFLGSLMSFILPIIFTILISKINISIEEKNLEKKFRKEYLNYKNNVRRWI